MATVLECKITSLSRRIMFAEFISLLKICFLVYYVKTFEKCYLTFGLTFKFFFFLNEEF